MAGYWLKLYTEILDDLKYYRHSDNAKLGMIELLVVAKKVDLGGELPSLEDVAFYTRRSEAWWLPVFAELAAMQFIVHNGTETIIRNFAQRQQAVSGAERTRQFRAAKHREEFIKHECNEPVTLSYGEEEKDTELNSEEIKKQRKKAQKTPASAATQYLPEGQFSEKVFTTITGMVTFPSRDAPQAIHAIEYLRDKYPEMTTMITYLQPFYDDWLKRKYSKTNLAWLTEWAVSGEIPKPCKPKIKGDNSAFLEALARV